MLGAGYCVPTLCIRPKRRTDGCLWQPRGVLWGRCWSAVCALALGQPLPPSLGGGRWLMAPGLAVAPRWAGGADEGLALLFQDWQGGRKASPGAGG